MDITPFVSGVGTLVSSALSSREAEKQRKWQEMFYQNRHQWEVADLKAAGLNPILSALNGSAGVPSGAMAQVGDLGASISRGVNSAVSRRLASVAESKAESEIAVNNATSDKLKSDAAANDQWIFEGKYRVLDTIADIGLKNATSAKEKEMIEKLRSEVQKDIAQVEVYNQQLSVYQEQINKYRQEIDYLKQQGRESVDRQSLYRAEAGLASAEARYKNILGKKTHAETETEKSYKRLIDSNIIPINKENKWDENHPALYNWRKTWQSIMPGTSSLRDIGKAIGAFIK